MVCAASPERSCKVCRHVRPGLVKSGVRLGQCRIHRGARCIRFVGMRLPLLFPLALLLWVPGVIWIAEKIYNLLARNRKVLSRLFGCKEACSILPARKREQDEVR